MQGVGWLLYLPFYASLAVSMLAAVYTLTRKSVPGSRYFALLLTAEILWIFGALLEISDPTLNGKLFWDSFQYLGYLWAGPLILVFAMSYAHSHTFNSYRLLLLLSVFPILGLIVVCFPQFSALVRSDPHLAMGDFYLELTYGFTPFVYITSLYTYVTALLGIFILIRHLSRQPRFFRLQSLAVIIGISLPIAGGLLTMSGLTFGLPRDISPFTFGLGNTILAWGLFRQRLFNLVPLARQSVLESLNAGYIVVDENDRVVDINHVAVRLFDANLHPSWHGQSLQTFLPEWEQWKKLFAGGQDLIAEYTAPQGHSHLEVRISPLKDRENILKGLLLLFHDITARVAGEQAIRQARDDLELRVRMRTSELASSHESLEESRRILQSTLESSSAGVLVSNSAGHIIVSNTNLARVWKLDPDDLQKADGRPLFAEAMAKVKDPEVFIQKITLINQTQNKENFEFTLLDGRTLDVFTAPLVGGEALGRVWIFNDITERRLHEVERDHLIRELESKNNELERFTYTVSHDLKSPLITIKGYAGSLAKDLTAGRSDRMRADITRIERAADKMSELLSDLLELSRIGRMINPSTVFSLTASAKDARELLTGLLQNKNAVVEISDDLPLVTADRHRILEVFQNLIENAIKFASTVTDHPRVEIGCVTVDGEDRVFVRDNGPGIESKYQDKIFGLFEKVNPAAEGTGIGLALVHRIITLHGGRVWVDSQWGNGACFYFVLPTVSLPKDKGSP